MIRTLQFVVGDTILCFVRPHRDGTLSNTTTDLRVQLAAEVAACADLRKRIASLESTAPAPKKQQKLYDYSDLKTGMKLQIESDGTWFAGEIVQVSESKSRSKAPLKGLRKGFEEALKELFRSF